MVLFASPDRPPLLTDKQTLRRGATLSAYDKEMNSLYERKGIPDILLRTGSQNWSYTEVGEFVRSTVRYFVPSVCSDHEDIFAFGCTR